MTVTGGNAGAVTTASGSLKFTTPDTYRQVLRRRVEEYFATTGLRPRDCPQMYVKSAILFSGCFGLYALLVFGGLHWGLALPLGLLLGLTIAGVGFNIQHDGGHGAYSRHRWINKLASMTLDLLGGSSYVWARKHNTIHHSYTNVTGHDDDINVGLLGRLSPHQKRLPLHRLQHFYLWALYGFLPIKWHLYDDFRDLITGRIAGHAFPRPKGWNLVNFIGGKAVFFSLAFGLPLLLHPFWTVLGMYALISFVQGVVLSVVFQLAHCVEDAEFPLPSPETGRVESSWAVHQIETTVNFAPRNRLLHWFVGGLNFQIEHHLFPQICHIHYPKLSKVVQETCREFGLRYKVYQSLFAGIAAHFRWLRQMGMPEPARPLA